MTARRRSTAAERKRAERKRRKCGLAYFRLELPEELVIGALLDAEILTEEQALRRRLVERELALVVENWASQNWPAFRWQK